MSPKNLTPGAPGKEGTRQGSKCPQEMGAKSQKHTWEERKETETDFSCSPTSNTSESSNSGPCTTQHHPQKQEAWLPVPPATCKQPCDLGKPPDAPAPPGPSHLSHPQHGALSLSQELPDAGGVSRWCRAHHESASMIPFVSSFKQAQKDNYTSRNYINMRIGWKHRTGQRLSPVREGNGIGEKHVQASSLSISSWSL